MESCVNADVVGKSARALSRESSLENRVHAESEIEKTENDGIN